jgi:hypothetical protein
MIRRGLVVTAARQRTGGSRRASPDLVMRLDVYLGDRDGLEIGFSSNCVFHKQYYLQAMLTPELRVFLHTGERFLREQRPTVSDVLLTDITTVADKADDQTVVECDHIADEWQFPVRCTGFRATLTPNSPMPDRCSFPGPPHDHRTSCSSLPDVAIDAHIDPDCVH